MWKPRMSLRQLGSLGGAAQKTRSLTQYEVELRLLSRGTVEFLETCLHSCVHPDAELPSVFCNMQSDMHGILDLNGDSLLNFEVLFQHLPAVKISYDH